MTQREIITFRISITHDKVVKIPINTEQIRKKEEKKKKIKRTRVGAALQIKNNFRIWKLDSM